jgi:ribosomal protein S18 acetylase RimI-like enzyme
LTEYNKITVLFTPSPKPKVGTTADKDQGKKISMKLTNAQKRDWLPRLWDITLKCYTGAQLPCPSFFEECVTFGDVWTVHDGGELGTEYEIVGYALCNNVYPTGPLLRSVAVLPEWRGRGLGGFLLREIEKYFNVRGANKIVLHCKVDNPAQKLYFNAGYRVTARIKNYYAPEGDGLEMERVL